MMKPIYFFRWIKLTLVLCFFLIFFVSCTGLNSPGHKQGNSSLPGVSPEDRFIVFDTGVVFDKITGLEWYSGDVTSLDNNGTRFWLSRLNKTESGWRLPTHNELYNLNKNGRKYCKSLDLTRDIFWIRNYRAYNLLSHIDVSPRMPQFGHRFFFGRHRLGYDENDDDYEVRAHIIVVRSKNGY